MKLDSWKVAAAILLRNSYCMRCGDLTQEILETELTTLGMKGGATTEKTVRTVLLKKEIDGCPVFEKQGDGYYGLADRKFVQSLPEVQEATRRLEALSSD